jgi:putative toxin-antitoxin system antitoxin component (TIGR02293 family)
MSNTKQTYSRTSGAKAGKTNVSKSKATKSPAAVSDKSKSAAWVSWFDPEKNASLTGKFEDIDGLSNIVRVAIKGVDTKVFYAFASSAAIPDKYLAELINTSPRTLSNYKEQHKPLEPVKGEHLLRLIALFKKGEEVFGTLREFQGWLTKPKMKADKAPIDWLITPGGVDLVSQELDRIAYGYPV